MTLRKSGCGISDTPLDVTLAIPLVIHTEALGVAFAIPLVIHMVAVVIHHRDIRCGCDGSDPISDAHGDMSCDISDTPWCIAKDVTLAIPTT